jgi:membrane-associated phospholipid phosphatase
VRPRAGILAVAAAAAFAALAGLVAAGAAAPLDQYAVDHWMPHLRPSAGAGSSSLVSSHVFVPDFGGPLETFCNLWTLPASVVLSTALVGACCVVLVRRRERRAALAWAAAWLAANAVELLGKSLLDRPSLHLGLAPEHLFDDSFPSGHALRAILAVAVLASVRRGLALPGITWVAVALPALVVSTAHTPSDVLGGLLLAAAAVLATRAWLGAGRRREVAPRVELRMAVVEEP